MKEVIQCYYLSLDIVQLLRPAFSSQAVLMIVR